MAATATFKYNLTRPGLMAAAFLSIVIAFQLLPAISQDHDRWRGFDYERWREFSPQEMCPSAMEHLTRASKAEVTSLLGKPDSKNSAGEGMWGHYDEYWTYTLNSPRDGKEHPSYVWETYDVSFAADGIVSKSEIRGHCY